MQTTYSVMIHPLGIFLIGEDIGTIPGKDMMPYACQRHDFYNMGHDKFD